MTKKTLTLLLGLIFVAALASAGVITVTGPSSGTYEYFGVAKGIGITKIEYELGSNYVSNDKLTFKLPAGFLFKNATYSLIGVTTGTEDEDGDGTNDFQYFSGGKDCDYVTFRVTDPDVAASLKYQLFPVGDPNIFILVPASPSSSTTGVSYKISTESKTPFGEIFDISEPKTFFTSYYEWTASATAVESTIDVMQGRKFFIGTGNKNSDLTFSVGVNAVPLYKTAGTLDQFDNFTVTVTGDMSAIAEIRVRNVIADPTDDVVLPTPTSPAVLNCPADKFLFANNTCRITVTGTDIIADRDLKFELTFSPNVTKQYNTRKFFTLDPAWKWRHNGTVFRSAWLATARSSNITAIRLSNLSTVAAKVYADIFMDDGQVAKDVYLGEIPAGGILSLDGYAIAKEKAGLNVTADTSGTWKGRIVIVVWGKPDNIFGYSQYVTPTGITFVTLEKQVSGFPYWEY